MKCPKCGRQMPDGIRYCGKCGWQMNRPVQSRLIPLLVVVLLVIALFAVGRIRNSRNDPGAAAGIHNAQDAISYLEKLGRGSQYQNALSELTEMHTTVIDGDSYYRLQQNYQGLPVFGRAVVCAVGEGGNVMSVTGNVIDIDENINLTPSINKERLDEIVHQYMATSAGTDLSEQAADNLFTYTLSIYLSQHDDRLHLAYVVSAGSYLFVIDAHSAEVLSISETLYENTSTSTGYCASDTNKRNGFIIEKQDDSSYTMRDPTRGLTVYTFNGRISKEQNLFWSERATIVESPDVIFGNTDAERALKYEDGAKLLQYATSIYEYYASMGFESSAFDVALYYDDGYDNGKNALGGTVNGVGTISMGSVTGVHCLDVIAHEYTHFVSRVLVNWVGNCENGALNEAMSDIMGEIIESIISQKPIDWEMYTYRNIHDPFEQSTPIAYKGLYWKETSSPTEQNDSGFVHNNSTVISHAAYLMWNGIDEDPAKKISTENLAKLWYRAMLMMPSDCDFVTCRQMVEWAALAVDELTDVQRKCIAEAFDLVGIYDTELPTEILVDCDRHVKPDAVLNVYNIDGELHSGYTLEIVGTIAEHELAYASNIILDTGFHYDKTAKVDTAEPYALNLPDGYYTFRITDSNNPAHEYTFTVAVSDAGTESSIDLHTDFRDQIFVVVTEPPEEEREDLEEQRKPLTQLNVYQNGKLHRTYFLQYNEKDQLTGAVFAEDVFLAKFSFTYNQRGQLLEADRDNFWMYFGNDEYTYDDSGNLICHSHYWGGGELPYYQYLFEYDGQGNMTGLTALYPSFDGDQLDVSFVDSFTYVFDAEGRVIERHEHLEWMDSDHDMTTDYGTFPYSEYVKVERYSYDEEGRVTAVFSEDIPQSMCNPLGNPDLEWDEKTLYHYDYAPLVLIETTGRYSQYKIQIQDSAGQVIWTQSLGDNAPNIDADGYILGSTDTYNEYRYELIYGEEISTEEAIQQIIIEQYKAALQDHPEVVDSFKTEYTLYDIDKDGIRELIIRENLHEYHVYASDGRSMWYCNKLYLWYPDCLYAYDGNGLVVYDGGQGTMHLEYVFLYTLSDWNLTMEKTLASTEESPITAIDDCLKQFTPISEFYSITDYAPLQDLFVN